MMASSSSARGSRRRRGMAILTMRRQRDRHAAAVRMAVAIGLSFWVVARLLEAGVQRAAIDAEDAGGVGLVAADRVEHLADVAALHLVERDQLARRFGGDH